MRDKTILAAALLMLAICGAAMAEGQGNSGTDRSNKPKSAAVCGAGELAVAAAQSDGRIVWTCVPVEAAR
ncbi:hypothetical protein [Lysobacter enzymogenes]|uniref:hypothetical protein n=1 Tax=Lysobacter enzymogenes TaxID=69 RepID=UPI001A964630|nr:hypothetical protein [Lysobacter enzymogenes]QQP97921.1 hypothetical protein JHW38_07940 [Lysobacter enzymogenes]